MCGGITGANVWRRCECVAESPVPMQSWDARRAERYCIGSSTYHQRECEPILPSQTDTLQHKEKRAAKVSRGRRARRTNISICQPNRIHRPRPPPGAAGHALSSGPKICRRYSWPWACARVRACACVRVRTCAYVHREQGGQYCQAAHPQHTPATVPGRRRRRREGSPTCRVTNHVAIAWGDLIMLAPPCTHKLFPD